MNIFRTILWTILWASYEHLMNILWTSYEHLRNILWTYYEHLTNLLWKSYWYLTNTLPMSLTLYIIEYDLCWLTKRQVDKMTNYQVLCQQRKTFQQSINRSILKFGHCILFHPMRKVDKCTIGQSYKPFSRVI